MQGTEDGSHRQTRRVVVLQSAALSIRMIIGIIMRVQVDDEETERVEGISGRRRGNCPEG